MDILNTIDKKNILVIGDVMVDTYFSGDVKRISPEAPVPVFRKKSERCVLGGAANVAANLVAAGQSVSIMSIVGNDDKGKELIDIFEKQDINIDLIRYTNRCTTEKTRFLASNNQQVMRLDVEDTTPLSIDECKTLLEELEKKINQFDLVLISDYMKGLLTYDFTQGVISISNHNNIPVIVDVKDPQCEKYDGATLLKPNLKELADLTKRDVSTDDRIVSASEFLRNKCNCKYVLTTCGSRGMLLVGDGDPYFISSVGHEVFDVTGAGDTTIAYLAACMVNKMNLRNSVDISNVAAGIQVSKVGTSSVFWREIREALTEHVDGSVYKIITEKAIANFRKDHMNKKIVFTNGCFDILHVGHIRYLQEAAKLGDLLIVGLNSDDSVRRLKGSDRPINSELERAEMLVSLGFVDYVTIFDEDTPLNIIKLIQPDVLVKGGDYSIDNVVGRKEVEDRGGSVVLIPFVEGKSTTNIINKIKR